MAFTRPGPDTEELVLAVEGRPPADLVRTVVAREFGVTVEDLVTVTPGALPRTTSGKPHRQEARRRYLAGEL